MSQSGLQDGAHEQATHGQAILLVRRVRIVLVALSLSRMARQALSMALDRRRQSVGLSLGS